MFFLSLTCLKLYQALGVLWISSDQEDQMGAKIESKTISRAPDCSEHPPPPKKKLPTSIKPTKYVPNFPTQKNPGNENFKPPKIH